MQNSPQSSSHPNAPNRRDREFHGFTVEVVRRDPGGGAASVPLSVETKPGVFAEPGGRVISLQWVRGLLASENANERLDRLSLTLIVSKETPAVTAESLLETILLIKEQYDSLESSKPMTLCIVQTAENEGG